MRGTLLVLLGTQYTCQMRKKTVPSTPGGSIRAERPQEPALSVRLPWMHKRSFTVHCNYCAIKKRSVTSSWGPANVLVTDSYQNTENSDCLVGVFAPLPLFQGTTHLPSKEYAESLTEHQAEQDEDLDAQVPKGERQD